MAALALLAGCAGDCSLFGPSEEEQKAALVEWVQSSQKEGITDQNLQAFMRIWAEDAELISARTERPGPYDVVTPIDVLEDAQRVRFAAEPDHSVHLRFRDESVHLEDDRALVRWITVRKTESDRLGRVQERIAEWFRLERRDDRWLVVENRYWPLETSFGDETIVYDESYFREQDAKVEAARAAGDRMVLLEAHVEARQLVPALELARALCTEDPATVQAWRHRAWLASSVGDIEESREAYRRLRTLDPEAFVPGWAR